MSYVLLLIFFTSTDGKSFLLTNTTNMDVADVAACKAAATGVWNGFKDTKLVKLAAWCVPKDVTDGKKVERIIDFKQ